MLWQNILYIFISSCCFCDTLVIILCQPHEEAFALNRTDHVYYGLIKKEDNLHFNTLLSFTTTAVSYFWNGSWYLQPLLKNSRLRRLSESKLGYKKNVCYHFFEYFVVITSENLYKTIDLPTVFGFWRRNVSWKPNGGSTMTHGTADFAENVGWQE